MVCRQKCPRGVFFVCLSHSGFNIRRRKNRGEMKKANFFCPSPFRGQKCSLKKLQRYPNGGYDIFSIILLEKFVPLKVFFDLSNPFSFSDLSLDDQYSAKVSRIGLISTRHSSYYDSILQYLPHFSLMDFRKRMARVTFYFISLSAIFCIR